MSSLRDFLDFIRFGMSSFAALITILGYIMFNSIGLQIIFAAFSSFCVMGASRAYNSLNDVKEDSINRKRINPLTFKKERIPIIVILFSLGFVSSLFLTTVSTIVYLLVVTSGIAYSLFRLNARSFSHLIKNSYGAVFASLLFLLGAGALNAGILLHYVLLIILIFGISVTADLRDYPGDKKTGKKTLPTTLGYKEAKLISSAVLLVFSFLTFHFFAKGFLLFAFFSFFAVVLILKNKPRFAHVSSGIASLLTIFWIMIIL